MKPPNKIKGSYLYKGQQQGLSCHSMGSPVDSTRERTKANTRRTRAQQLETITKQGPAHRIFTTSTVKLSNDHFRITFNNDKGDVVGMH
ncbi:unnamed protein product [Linum trigynum]|uniref:Uncharacterized protein n=1 Tax=Linum trigynum TaxID=586398 RepID=A0AAV2DEG3_9ROSI